MRFLIYFLTIFFSVSAQAYDIQTVKAGGITAWLVQDKSLPMVVVRMSFREGGYAWVKPEEQGLPTLVSRTLKDGAGNLKDDAFREQLEDNAIELGFGVGEDEFSISLQTLAEKKDIAFSLLGKALHEPHFEAAAMERAKTELLTAMEQVREDAASLSAYRFAEVGFAGHPYSYSPYGIPATLKNFKGADLRGFIARRFCKENLVISVAGDVSADELKPLLLEAFGALPDRCELAPEVAKAHLREGGEVVRENFDGPQTVVTFGLPGMARNDERFYGWYILNHLLGGSGLNSWLADAIREKRGLAYYIYTSPDSNMRSAQLRGTFASRNETAGEAIKLLKQTIADIRKRGISEKELAEAKKYLIGSFPLQLDTLRSRASFIQMIQLERLGKDYLEKRNGYMERVTLEEINGLVQEYLHPEKLFIVSVGHESRNPEKK